MQFVSVLYPLLFVMLIYISFFCDVFVVHCSKSVLFEVFETLYKNTDLYNHFKPIIEFLNKYDKFNFIDNANNCISATNYDFGIYETYQTEVLMKCVAMGNNLDSAVIKDIETNVRFDQFSHRAECVENVMEQTKLRPKDFTLRGGGDEEEVVMGIERVEKFMLNEVNYSEKYCMRPIFFLSH